MNTESLHLPLNYRSGPFFVPESYLISTVKHFEIMKTIIQTHTEEEGRESHEGSTAESSDWLQLTIFFLLFHFYGYEGEIQRSTVRSVRNIVLQHWRRAAESELSVVRVSAGTVSVLDVFNQGMSLKMLCQGLIHHLDPVGFQLINISSLFLLSFSHWQSFNLGESLNSWAVIAKQESKPLLTPVFERGRQTDVICRLGLLLLLNLSSQDPETQQQTYDTVINTCSKKMSARFVNVHLVVLNYMIDVDFKEKFTQKWKKLSKKKK